MTEANSNPRFYAEGGNYRVELDEGVATMRVWRRPDVSREVGAGYAQEMVAVYRRLAAEPWTQVRGVVMDLRDATTTWGPVTRAAVGEMFELLEQAGRRCAVVTANDALQMMHVVAIVREHAPKFGRVFGSITAASRWASLRRQSAR